MRKRLYLESVLFLSAAFYLFAGTGVVTNDKDQTRTYHTCPYLQKAYEKGCPAFSGESKDAKKTKFSPGKSI